MTSLLLPILLQSTFPLQPGATQPAFPVERPVTQRSRALPTIDELRLSECIGLAIEDPPSAIVEGSKWRQENGGWRADICLANGYAENFEFSRSLPHFEKGANAAAREDQDRANQFWLQAGNAAIAADRPNDAIRFIDRALAKGSMATADRAEALIDRARAYVASGQAAQAKTDLFAVRRLTPENLLGWLLSATLARREGELTDAQDFIATAASLGPRDPAVALEAGNIASALGENEQAATHWKTAIELAPGSRQAKTARQRLGIAQPEPQTR